MVCAREMRLRILALQLKRIGDLILTAPALGAIRKAAPDSEITLLCEHSAAGLLPAMPCHRGLARGQRGFWAVVLRGGYDVCLDFTGTDRSALLGVLSRARRRVGFRRFTKKFPRRMAYNVLVDSDVRTRHTVDHYCDLLEPLGISVQEALPSLDWPGEAFRSAHRLLDAHGIADPYAIIHPGTARPEKAWAPERWASIVTRLQSRGLSVVLTGAELPAERAQAREVCALAPEARDLSGKTSLLELGALIRRASLFCGVDSAAMHLADAAGTPCVCLFGPTNPFHWQPRNTAVRVLRAKTQEPFAPGQPGGSMELLSVEEVAAAVDSLVGH